MKLFDEVDPKRRKAGVPPLVFAVQPNEHVVFEISYGIVATHFARLRPESLRGWHNGHAHRLIHQAGNLPVVVEYDPLNDSLLFKRQDQLRRLKALQLAASALVDALEGWKIAAIGLVQTS